MDSSFQKLKSKTVIQADINFGNYIITYQTGPINSIQFNSVALLETLLWREKENKGFLSRLETSVSTRNSMNFIDVPYKNGKVRRLSLAALSGMRENLAGDATDRRTWSERSFHITMSSLAFQVLWASHATTAVA